MNLCKGQHSPNDLCEECERLLLESQERGRKKHAAHAKAYGERLRLCQSPAEELFLDVLLGHTLDFEQQLPIAKFRADFAFPASRLVVEIDGFDFHDRTREMADRDKDRDRVMLAHGWRVARFSGRQVLDDPFSCVREVLSLVSRAA